MTTLEIPAREFIARVQTGEIPDTARVTVTYEAAEPNGANSRRVLHKLHQWQRETATQTAPAVLARELFARFNAEDIAMTDEEKWAESRLWVEVEQGISESRAERD